MNSQLDAQADSQRSQQLKDLARLNPFRPNHSIFSNAFENQPRNITIVDKNQHLARTGSGEFGLKRPKWPNTERGNATTQLRQTARSRQHKSVYEDIALEQSSLQEESYFTKRSVLTENKNFEVFLDAVLQSGQLLPEDIKSQLTSYVSALETRYN